MGAKRIGAALLAAGLAAVAALAQANSPAATDAVRSRFVAGQEALNARNFPQAEEAYRGLLELAPDLAEARANLGLVLFLQGKFQAAVTELGRVAGEKPDLGAAHLFLGLSQLKLGAPGRAIPSLERVLRHEPGNLEARRALAACYLAQKDYASAVREYQAAFSHTPDRTEAWYRLGRDYMNLMSELAGALVVGRPGSVWSSRLGADMLGLSQAWDAAVQYYEAAVAKKPDLPGLHASLGQASIRLGAWDAAESHFRAELGIDPFSEDAWLGLAEVSLVRGDAAGALESVARVWAANPRWLLSGREFPLLRIPAKRALSLIAGLPRADGGPSRFLQAALFGEAGGPERARLHLSLLEGELRKAPLPAAGGHSAEELCRRHLFASCAEKLASRPSLARSELLQIGRAYRALGQDERAVIAFTHALKGSAAAAPEAEYWTVRTLQSLADGCFRQVEALAPGSWRAHQLRAEAYRQRQEDDRAIAEYMNAIEANPDEPELHRSVGLIQLLNNAYDEAESSLRRALELDGSNPRTLYFVGRLFVARQQHAEAVPYLEAALRLDPNLVEARPSLGRAYLRVGRFEDAATQFERGLVLDYYGDIHYSLFQAYRQLGKAEDARRALERSTAMRRSSFARDRSKFDRWIKSE